ncbi:MAG: hypothetical protein ACPG4Z_02380 [Chitinophagales bacterium]
MVHLHSSLRYLILIFLVITVINATKKWLKKEDNFTSMDDKFNLITFILCHIQLLVGAVLVFTTDRLSSVEGMGDIMGNGILRFFFVEHIFMMIIAIVLITVGRISSKKITDNIARHKRIAITFGIALLLILSAIPSFRGIVTSTGWF